MTYTANLKFDNGEDVEIDLEFTAENIKSLVSHVCKMELKRRKFEEKHPFKRKQIKYHRSYAVDKSGVVQIPV